MNIADLHHAVKVALTRAEKRQADLAKALHLHPSTLSSYLSGALTAPPNFERDVRRALTAIQREART